MTNKPIQQAIENLAIQGVFLRTASIKQHPDFDPRLDRRELQIQTRSGPTRLSDLEVKADSDAETQELFHVHFSCGLRLTNPEFIEEAEPETGVAVEMLATFVAEYMVKPGSMVSQEARNAFARDNVGYHVWPYWREYVQSTCARLGLPIVAIQMYRVPKASQRQTKQRRSKKAATE